MEMITEQKRRFSLSLGSIVLMLGILSFVGVIGWAYIEQNRTLGENRPAPTFTLTTFDGEEFDLEDYRGQIVVLNFWASWCAPCHAEAPDLQRIHERYAERGVVLVGITYSETSVEDSLNFIEQYGLTYRNGADPRMRIADSYRITGVPETFVIRQDGKIVKYYPGSINETILSNVLETLLAEDNAS
ncbi:MAG: hypothetical protein CUN56_03000 [Phototrophicales bacterium]|nr:MAG: hypothetical protein CUN56_03000 [Phototrophicales bacterium]RMG72853.1 MAG: hypothetical protein D6711_12180 [Chloroflexota bacterium]